MTLVLVAHGTRRPEGSVVVEQIAALLRPRLDVPVLVAYADVRQPDVTTVLRSIDGPAVVVPAFLASGYHVRVDVPQQIRASGRADVVLTAPLGPHPALVGAMHDRLLESGWRRGDAVVLAAAGSSDARALADVRAAAALLSVRTGSVVPVSFVATAVPRVPDVVAGSPGRVGVASWLLAPGLFHSSLASCGADAVGGPIGAHPRLVDLVLHRYAAGIVDASTRLSVA
ncbi:sirohydrochlorin chelatase [Umezawaea beigongshangensis]|uniref:sirohydrochlorin chelatase n=1 Tax=Umezawaea beigongshangensis TaxID=2780383 RepID=UPI0018F1DE43|nr:sirohydrochlorin chelatase [Umezawaea beigongshangensis]